MSKQLFSLLYIAGLGIIWSAFLLLRPAEAKTDIVCLNAAVVSLIYSSAWLKYNFLFPSRGDAGDHLAGSGIYWYAQGSYTCFSILVMLAGLWWAWNFKTQLLLQIVSLFIFLIYIACSVFTVERVSRCTRKDHETMAPLQEMRRLIASISASATMLPESDADSRRIISELAEELEYVSGVENPEAAALDEKIIRRLGYLKALISPMTAPEEIRKVSREIMTMIIQRKSLKNIG